MARYAVLKSDMSGTKGHRDYYLVDANGDDRLKALFDDGLAWDTSGVRWPSKLYSMMSFVVVAAVVGMSLPVSDYPLHPMRNLLIGLNDVIVGSGIVGTGFDPDAKTLADGVLRLIAVVGGITVAFILVQKLGWWLTRRFAPAIYIFDATDGENAYRRTMILPDQFEAVADGEMSPEDLAKDDSVERLREERQRLEAVIGDERSSDEAVGKATKRIQVIDRTINSVTK